MNSTPEKEPSAGWQSTPGDLVLDFCAAPGGKTTHLAQKMENKGKIIAMDIHDHRLTLIEENATRLGITNIRALLHDGTKPLPGFENRADAVLVDAPCSGLGVLNRRAEARWTKKERHGQRSNEPWDGRLRHFPVLGVARPGRSAHAFSPSGFISGYFS